MDYWLECVKEAFEDANITATDEQIDTVVSWVEGAYENEGLARGIEAIPNPLQLENSNLKRQLERERNKQVCAYCKGRGYIVVDGPAHSAESNCSCDNGWIYSRT